MIESGFSAGVPRTIDRQAMEAVAESPLTLLDLLETWVGVAWAADRDVLDAELVRRAAEGTGSLGAEETREVELTLLTGARAPRNPTLAAQS